jgi:multidrug resistance efflux pump
MSPQPRSEPARPAAPPRPGDDGVDGDGRLAPARSPEPAPVEPGNEAGRTPAAFAAGLPWRRIAPFAAIAAAIAIAVIVYLVIQASHHVGIDDAVITAPQVQLAAHGGGPLKQDYASVGDMVKAHHPIIRVGNEVISSDVDGTVISIRQDIGASIAPGTPVATLISRGELRAVGRIKEDKGLSDIHIGQQATVSVDALSGPDLHGIVDEISEEPHQQQLSFSISDKHEAKEYDVKVHFEGPPNPDLRQGMSASITVQK